MQTLEIPEWPYAYGGPSGSGKLRTHPEDFWVYEVLGFEPSGTGEHAFLQIEKRGENTVFVAGQLAKFAGVSSRDVSFAGLKDRHAVTTQWFSVWLPGKPDPDWKAFESETISVVRAVRHIKKLKRGALSGNDFKLVVRDWKGDMQLTIKQLERMKANGLPNYFGPQRFGNAGQNVGKALAMFQGERVKRNQRSLYISAVRSFLFNHILTLRIQKRNWDQAISGDALMFDRSGKYFRIGEADEDVIQRVNAGMIHPTGSLWGKGQSDLSSDALEIENRVTNEYKQLVQGLYQSGVEISRRSLRVNINDLIWAFNGERELKLSFSLPAGSYATSVIREIVDFKE